MLLDVRTYTCRPGTIKKHLELYAKMGAEPQSRNLGKPLLYMTTETGNPNQYVHIWAYENAGDDTALALFRGSALCSIGIFAGMP